MPEDAKPAAPVSGPPPSPEAVAASLTVATETPPPEALPELDELPEGQDQFDRAYVESLRGENAKWRQRTRNIEASFDGYTDAEQAKFLEMAARLHTDPEAAIEDFDGVANRLRKAHGKEVPVTEVPPVPPVADEAPVLPETDPALQPALTLDDVNRLVAEQLEAERAKATEADSIAATLAEAEALDPVYKDPSAKAQLFATAQQHGVDLASAHDLLSGNFATAVDAAVTQRLAEISSGAAHPPRLPAGDGAVEKKEPPKTLEEARARAEARFDAAYGSSAR